MTIDIIEASRPIDELIAELNSFSGRTKYGVVEEAVNRRGEISPLLIAYLQQVIDAPHDYYNLRWNEELLPYGLLLLAYLKEQSSHRLMLSLFHLPHHNLDVMIGDMTTIALPVLLLRTCGGSLQGIKDLISCKECDDFVRWAAMEALTYAVGCGMAERDEMLSFFRGLLTGEEAEAGSYFWLGVANSLCDLYPSEGMDEILAAYSRGLIPPRELSMEEIEETIDLGLDYAMKKLREEARRSVPDDLHGILAKYENFASQPSLPPNSSQNQKKKGQKKSKKKMTKASRRKNR